MGKPARKGPRYRAPDRFGRSDPGVRTVEVGYLAVLPNLLPCLRDFMRATGMESEGQAGTLLLMAGLGLSLGGEVPFEAALGAFRDAHPELFTGV